jgi:hypothetical protein
MTETRYQRIAREQRERQERRETLKASLAKAARKRSGAIRPDRERRLGSPDPDGYDRDDLGESPDY